jgi:YHS domain-containing protein
VGICSGYFVRLAAFAIRTTLLAFSKTDLHTFTVRGTMKLLTILFLFCSSLVLAQSNEVRIAQYNLKKTIAIEGYDPVSYFDNKPVEGKIEFKITHKGVTYLFANAANLAKFKASPDKYEPSYGGWCAYAMGETGEKVKVDPETFKIVNGKLNLFYNFWGTNTLKDWNKNETSLKAKADQNWKKFVQ